MASGGNGKGGETGLDSRCALKVTLMGVTPGRRAIKDTSQGYVTEPTAVVELPLTEVEMTSTEAGCLVVVAVLKG